MGILADLLFRLRGFGYGPACLDHIVIQRSSTLEVVRNLKKDVFVAETLSKETQKGT